MKEMQKPVERESDNEEGKWEVKEERFITNIQSTRLDEDDDIESIKLEPVYEEPDCVPSCS